MKTRKETRMSLETTPNVVIKNPNVRRWLGGSLYGIGLLTGIAALFLLFFPEVEQGGDIPTRAIAFANAVVSILSNAFGVAVSTPNVPREPVNTWKIVSGNDARV